jgi:hypothetical protein
MGILARIVTIIGALLFFTIVFIVGLAFIEYIESADEKNRPTRITTPFPDLMRRIFLTIF